MNPNGGSSVVSLVNNWRCTVFNLSRVYWLIQSSYSDYGFDAGIWFVFLLGMVVWPYLHLSYLVSNCSLAYW